MNRALSRCKDLLDVHRLVLLLVVRTPGRVVRNWNLVNGGGLPTSSGRLLARCGICAQE